MAEQRKHQPVEHIQRWTPLVPVINHLADLVNALAESAGLFEDPDAGLEPDVGTDELED